MKKISLLFASVMLISISAQSVAQTTSKDAEISNLKNSLSKVTTSQDSIRLLYDIFDLSSRKDQKTVGKQIYDIAKRTNDQTTQLDILRLLAGYINDQDAMAKIEKEAMTIPDSRDKEETLLFIKIKRLAYDARHLPEDQRQKEIVKLMTEQQSDQKQKADDNLINLFTLVEYLRNDASGDVLKPYLDRLIKITNPPQFNSYALRNLTYSEIANIYSDTGDHEKAIQADKELLKIIDNLEKFYAEKGRNYRNYDISRYIVYRRMLRNYESLSKDEVQEYYNKCLALSKRNEEIRNDIENSPSFYAYYYMATGDYNSAIPYLKRITEDTKSAPQVRKQMLKHLIEAADKTGDDATKLDALTRYSNILDELYNMQASNAYSRLKLTYDVQNLKNNNNDLLLKNKEDEVSSARRMMLLVIVAFIIILLSLIFFLHNWGRYKRNAAKMGHIVDAINRERRSMRHALFFDYADDPELNPFLDEEEDNRYSWAKRMKELERRPDFVSEFMTESIVNDLLYIASLAHDSRRKFINSTSVDSLMRGIHDRAKRLTDHRGKFDIEYPDKDYRIITDQECLIFLLAHVLNVTARYSPTDTVGLSARLTTDDHIEFVITIKGVGTANPGDPQIFHDFVYETGIFDKKNCGLFVCRMIDMLLKSSHRPDQKYVDGARYIFRLPVDLRD